MPSWLQLPPAPPVLVMSPGEQPDYILGLFGAVLPYPRPKVAILDGPKNDMLSNYSIYTMFPWK